MIQLNLPLYRILKNVTCCLFLILFGSEITAQVPDTLAQVSDTLAKVSNIIVSTPKNIKSRVRLVINWDARNSFVANKRVNIWGVNTGLAVGKKQNQITVGYYWLSFNSYLRLLDLKKNAAKRVNLDYYTKTDLYFFSLMFWKNFVNNKHWKISLPIEVGIGSTKNQGVDLLDDIQIWKKDDYFIPVQAGLYVGWKATRWVGLAVSGGYRYALITEGNNENYDGLYFSVGAELQAAIFKDTFRWIFKKKKKK